MRRPAILLAALLLAAGLLAACASFPGLITPPETPTPVPPTPEPTATPAPTPQPTPLATLAPGEPPVLALMPMRVGTTWVYSVTLDIMVGFDVVHWTGVVTETIRSANREADAWVFQSEATPADGLPIALPPYEDRTYYVALDGRLYQLFESENPAALVKADGKGFEGEQIAQWPLAVGQYWGDPNLSGIQDAMYRWLVETEGPAETPAGTFSGCYRLVYRTNPDTTMRWYCPGIGLVRHEYRHHGTRHNEIWELMGYQPGGESKK